MGSSPPFPSRHSCPHAQQEGMTHPLRKNGGGDGPSPFPDWQGTQLTLHPGSQACHPLRRSGDCRRHLIGKTVWGPHATGTVLRSNLQRSIRDPCILVVLLGGERGVSCLVLPLDSLPAPFPVVHAHRKGSKAALCQCLLSPWRTDSQELDTVADRCICSTDEFGGKAVSFLHEMRLSPKAPRQTLGRQCC